MHFPLLQDIVVILGLSILIIVAFQKLKLPSILGFLLAGIIAGPYAFNLISSSHEVELLSEIGIIFLLFVIGIEFSLKELAAIKNKVFIGGGIQVFGTIGFTTALALLMDIPWNTAVFLGFLFSLSSTAIVLKLMQEKGEVKSPHGKLAVGILIFQDIIVVPMMLFTPLLTGEADNILTTIGILTLKVLLVLVFIYILAKYIAPIIFKLVVKTRNKELFLLTVTVFCFAVAWLTASVGLSLALGAFFAGLIISESEYSHQATANVLPFREIFVSFFFVSVGTLLNLNFFFSHIGTIVLITLGVIVLKITVIALTAMFMHYPPRTIFLTAFTLFQIGEFSLLLSSTGVQNGLLKDAYYQYFLAVSILTMAATPFLMAAAPKLTDYIIQAPIPKAVRRRLKAYKARHVQDTLITEENLHDHLIIIGYGINGKNIAKAARNAKIPYAIAELSPDAFKEAKKNNEPVLFGDAAEDVILQHLHVQEARVIVIAISDPSATKKIVTIIRDYTKTACIIVRTRYVKEIDENLKIGADEVIPEEFETSIQIFTRVLKKYMVPNDDIQGFINQLRSSDYEMLTTVEGINTSLPTRQIRIPDKEVTSLYVESNTNKIVGKTVELSGIRKKYGVTILAIQRDKKYITEIKPDTLIMQGDLLFLFGNPDAINKLNKLFSI